MKTHTTNYYNTFIEVAEDCPTIKAEIPPQKGDTKTVANIQFEMALENPYKYTSDDIIFSVFADKNDISETEIIEAKKLFFSKGQACLRASPLTKRYGWGVHHNEEGKIALVSRESELYENFLKDNNIKKVKAMRSAKK